MNRIAVGLAATLALGVGSAGAWSHINPGEYRVEPLVIFYNPANAPAGVPPEQVRAGVETWDGQANIRVTYGGLTDAPISKWTLQAEDGVNVIAWMPDGSLASTIFSAAECDVRLGIGYEWGYYDATYIVAHEVGHCLGLGHSDVEGSVMWPYVGDERFEALSADDIAGLQAAYPYRVRVPEVAR